MRLLLFVLLAGIATAAERQILNFNPDWKFLKADPVGAEAPGFDDLAWTTVSAPHTFNDTDTFDNWSTPGHRGEQIQWSGRTWYRKTFDAPAAWTGQKVFIEFEAVRQVAEVYLNGQLLGTAKTGFTPFGFDLTPHLRTGGPNVLAVMVDNRFMKDPLDPAMPAQAATDDKTRPNLGQLSARVNETIPDNLADLQADQIPWNNPHWHPAHGGIYRNVRLIVTDPLHIELPLYSFLQTEGPYAYATDVTDAAAKICLEIPLHNELPADASAKVHAEIIDDEGRSVLVFNRDVSLRAGARSKLPGIYGTIPRPKLWEPAYPYLYHVVITLSAGGRVVDTAEIPLGIRAIRWTTDAGLFLNGAHLKLHGWGQKPTDEWPGLGAAQPDWMHFYTLQLMQQAGGNFVRWGHSAAGPAQISAGDRLGVIALQPGTDGESDTRGAAWTLRTMAFRDMLIYFRNNPSIFIWEGGNQKVTRAHAQELRGLVDQYDPHGGRALAFRRADATTAEFMDIGIGTEGGREIARLPVVEGEYDREESPRRVWDDFSPPGFGYPEAKGQAYQLTSEQYAVNEVGQFIKKISAPNHSGGANWIFSDSTSGGRVAVEVARASGEVDGVRLPKEAYYVVAALFRDDPQVHLIGHWTYPAGTRKTVYVASNGDDVELFLNGQSLGHGKVSNRYLFTFPDVAFAPGELKAVASRGGTIVARDARHTVGPAVALRLTPITGPDGLRADGSDIALFDVEAVDAAGDRCPTFQQRVDFDFSGPGTWRGGYNSGKIDSINHPWLDLEAGINRVAVRAGRTPGRLTVTARCAGLRDATASVESHEFAGALPALAAVPLPQAAPIRTITAAPVATAKTAGPVMLGQFIQTFSYTGPTATTVHIEVNARNGRNIYVDRDYAFADLPAGLAGADWVQLADADQRYSAADLVELAVAGGTTVSIAHDARAPLPGWLTRQFQPTDQVLTIHDKPMKIFQRKVEQAGSLTLGSNTDGPPVRANMYVVLVNATAPAR